jgi:hypothetical protein
MFDKADAGLTPLSKRSLLDACPTTQMTLLDGEEPYSKPET